MERRRRYLLGADETGKILRTHGEGGTNVSLPRERVITTLTRWNQPGRLRHNYTESKDSVQVRFDLENGGRVSIAKPINPYTSETLLVTAFEANDTKQQTTAEYIYEKSDALQHKYWQTTLAQLIALKKQTPLEFTSGQPFVDWMHKISRRISDRRTQRYIFFMENTGPLSFIDDKYRREDLDGFSPRTSRTGADIHLHVAAIHSSWLIPGRNVLPESDVERRTLRKLQDNGKAQEFLEQLKSEMCSELKDENTRKRLSDNLSFIIEEGVPVGYSLQFKDINERNALGNVEYFAQAMKAHFRAYKKTQQLLFGDELRRTAVPQPSFRTYGTFDSGKRKKDRILTITIAPQIFSYGGPLEAAGVDLERSPEFPTIGTDEQKQKYRKRVVQTTQRLMRDTVHEVRRVDMFTEPEWP